MKKFWILLALLYLVTCETVRLCGDGEDEKEPSKSDCFKMDLTEEEKKLKASCCYVKGKVTYEGESQTGASCMPLAPDQQSKSAVEKIIKEAMEGLDVKVEVKDVSCYSSYLKFGFLLLSLLLL